LSIYDKEITFERNDLYEKVWKIPITQLAKKYGISDAGLAKICRKLNVPHPPMGYWAKLKYGKSIKIPPLPSIGPGEPTKHVHYQYSQDESRSDIKQIAQDIVFPNVKIVVSDTLNEPHRFVKEINSNLKIPISDPFGLLTYYSRGIWVKVSSESKDRAIRIMDALIKGFESAGYSFKKKQDDYREFYILEVDGEKIEFSLTERTHRKDHILTAEERLQKKLGKLWSVKKYDYLPTGELSLNITNKISSSIRKSWNDCKGKRLEDQLSDFVRGAVLAAYVIKIERKKEEENKKKREEEHRRWQENEWIKTQEKMKVDRLISDAQQWNISELVRKYIKAIENRLSAFEADDKSLTDLKKWLSWAKEKSAEMNPINKIFPDQRLNDSEDIENE
jgi:hypothetical protein